MHRSEREFDYDASYLREILEVSPEALVRFGLAGSLGRYRRDVTVEVFYAASLTGVIRADCGPCAQLVTRFAEKDGVDPALLRALVAGELAGLPEPVRLAAEYADAVLSRAPTIDALKEQLEARFGPRGVISLAFAILGSQLYPTLKVALGHGRTCVAVEVAGEPVRPGGGPREGREAYA